MLDPALAAASRRDAARWAGFVLRAAVWMCRQAAFAFAIFSSAVVSLVALAFHFDPSLALTADMLPIVCQTAAVVALFAWVAASAARGRFWF